MPLDKRLPVVNTGNNENPMYLPAEACEVIEGQPYNAKLSGAQTRQMITFAVRKPSRNAHSIVDQGFKTVGLSKQSNSILVRQVSSTNTNIS